MLNVYSKCKEKNFKGESAFSWKQELEKEGYLEQK